MSKCCKDTQIYFDISGALLGAYLGYVVFRSDKMITSGGKKEPEKIQVDVVQEDKTVETAPQELPPEPPLPAPSSIPSIRSFLLRGTWWVTATSVTIYLKHAMKPYVLRIVSPWGRWLYRIFVTDTSDAARKLMAKILKKIAKNSSRDIKDLPPQDEEPKKKKGKKQKPKPSDEPTVPERFVFPSFGDVFSSMSGIGIAAGNFFARTSEEEEPEMKQYEYLDLDNVEEEIVIKSRTGPRTVAEPPTPEAQIQELRNLNNAVANDVQTQAQEELNDLSNKGKEEKTKKDIAVEEQIEIDQQIAISETEQEERAKVRKANEALEAEKRRQEQRKLLQANSEAQENKEEVNRMLNNAEKGMKAADVSKLVDEKLESAKKDIAEKVREQIVDEMAGVSVEIKQLEGGGQVTGGNLPFATPINRPERNNSNRPITDEDREISLEARRTAAKFWEKIQQQINADNAMSSTMKKAVQGAIESVQIQDLTTVQPLVTETTNLTNTNVDDRRAREIFRMIQNMYSLIGRMGNIIAALSKFAEFNEVSVKKGKKARSVIEPINALRAGDTLAATYVTNFLNILRERRRIAARILFVYLVLMYRGVDVNAASGVLDEFNTWLSEGRDRSRANDIALFMFESGGFVPSIPVSREHMFTSILRIPSTFSIFRTERNNAVPLQNPNNVDTSILAYFSQGRNRNVNSLLAQGLDIPRAGLNFRRVNPGPVDISNESLNDEIMDRTQNINMVLAEIVAAFDNFDSSTRDVALRSIDMREITGANFFRHMDQLVRLYIGAEDIASENTLAGRSGVDISYDGLLDMLESLFSRDMVNVDKFAGLFGEKFQKKK